MKKIILLASLLLPVLTVKGQQKLSYAYDAAGNRISRTIVVGAHNIEGEAPRSYIDTIDGRQLAINTGSGRPQLTIAVEEYDSSLTGEYSILDKEGTLLAKEELSGGTTLVELEELPSGGYILHILLNGHPSRWELVKL
ncbi:hypothetical protein [Proteiniphilum sp. X52]|uniref:hypothetical protein n=1 Tax=Proteiniphilum sp. X52 TaxID=2382159 RepID=UPI000F0A0B38|nr:hypothetical protein [Proteiniphilum sp. X52]RNC63240.1 hypothetical protein D7D25_17590 [Proteiniphilum sp. X52]